MSTFVLEILDISFSPALVEGWVKECCLLGQKQKIFFFSTFLTFSLIVSKTYFNTDVSLGEETLTLSLV